MSRLLPVALVATLAATAVAQPAAAQAFTITAPTSSTCVAPNFGAIAGTSVAYTLRPGFGNTGTAAAGCVAGWTGGYSNLPSAFWASGTSSGNPEIIEIAITATAPSTEILFSNIVLGSWTNNARPGNLRIFDGAYNLLFSNAGSAPVITSTAVMIAPPGVASQTLRIQYGPDTWGLGAGSVSATLRPSTAPPPGSVVPEPSTYALLATGLVGLAVAARRRRQ